MVSTPQHNNQFANDYRSESSMTVRKLIILRIVCPGAGSCLASRLGSLYAHQHTITRSNVILTPSPPLDSSAAALWAAHLGASQALCLCMGAFFMDGRFKISWLT